MYYSPSATLMYAEERASWILNHAREPWTFQKTRGELLLFEYDEHRRATAGVAYNPHVQRHYCTTAFASDAKPRGEVGGSGGCS